MDAAMRRVNLMKAHGSPTRYLYQHQGCRCKACCGSEAAYRRGLYAGNPGFRAQRNAYHQEWRAQHPGKDRDYRRCAFERDPDRFRESFRRWRAKNVEREQERGRAYYAAHREECAARGRNYRAQNREAVAEYKKRYRLEHLEDHAARESKRRARIASVPGEYTGADVCAQYERQRGKCYWCKSKLSGQYHVDHVIPVSHPEWGATNGPENIVVACPACNRSKNAQHPIDFAGVLC